ncbi:hypothetical protein AVEN_147584-1 [Araneus ventricosus]|uniref:Uncharacterized protein n=1 Tax=Araneus ventricosus TaxID=182803 RepID=A0A4Y2H4C7_ARAVE|nr:hypothetical protein AVEN_147584-1 [Araneus ventricosus]
MSLKIFSRAGRSSLVPVKDKRSGTKNRDAHKVLTVYRNSLIRCLQDNLHGSSSLWVILGIPPLHLQLERESRGTALYRLRLHLFTNVIDINPSEIEEKATGWSAHPSEHLSSTQIPLEDGGDINTGFIIYSEVFFFSEYSPFPSYLHRFNFPKTSFCSCRWNCHTNPL